MLAQSIGDSRWYRVRALNQPRAKSQLVAESTLGGCRPPQPNINEVQGPAHAGSFCVRRMSEIALATRTATESEPLYQQALGIPERPLNPRSPTWHETGGSRLARSPPIKPDHNKSRAEFACRVRLATPDLLCISIPS